MNSQITHHISPSLTGWSYFFIHLSVETCCFYWMWSSISEVSASWLWALLYDALAFVPQAIWGDLTDRNPKLDLCPPGLLLLLFSLCFKASLFGLLLLTCGNTLVHVAGAQSTLRGTDGKIAPAGIFVGGGSFGVILGKLLGLSRSPAGLYVSLSLLLLSLLLSFLLHFTDNRTLICSGYNLASAAPVSVIVVLAFITVAARAYIGYAIPTSWNKTEAQTIMLYCCMGVGKVLGGIICDMLGALKTSVFSLVIALPLLLFGNNLMTVSLLGVIFFSMTMSVSLGILVSCFAELPGICFGITTIGLFVGTVPTLFFDASAGYLLSIIMLTTITIVSFCIISKKQ